MKNRKESNMFSIVQHLSNAMIVCFPGVRGAIWFSVWGIVFLALAVFYPIVEMEVIIQGAHGDTKYMLAVGEGCARDPDDPVAAFDLSSVKQCMYKVQKMKGPGVMKPVPKYHYDPNLYQYT